MQISPYYFCIQKKKKTIKNLNIQKNSLTQAAFALFGSENEVQWSKEHIRDDATHIWI